MTIVAIAGGIEHTGDQSTVIIEAHVGLVAMKILLLLDHPPLGGLYPAGVLHSPARTWVSWHLAFPLLSFLILLGVHIRHRMDAIHHLNGAILQKASLEGRQSRMVGSLLVHRQADKVRFYADLRGRSWAGGQLELEYGASQPKEALHEDAPTTAIATQEDSEAQLRL